MKQKTKLSVAFVLVGVLCAFGLAKASSEIDDSATKTKVEAQAEKRAQIQERIEQKQTALEERKEEREQVREQKIEQICKNVEARIRTRINRYENNKKAHVNVFSNMLARLEKVVDRFQALNLDTAELEKDVASLRAKIEKLYQNHDAFIATLKTTEDFACGKSQGEFRAKLGQARSVAPEVRQEIVEIREFYQSNIRPEILALRAQLEDETEEEQEAEEEDENKETKQ